MPRFTRMLTGFDSTPAAGPPEAANVESDFVVILAALLCALICVVGLIAVARCAWLRRGSAGNSRSASQAAANKGLKKKVLQTLPKFTYGATAAGGGVGSGGSCKFGWTECSICLGEFAEGDEVRILTQCGHGFHVGCIDTWLGSHSSCPSCRQILVVARCQKCGQYPAISPAAGGGSAAETNCKGREDTSRNNTTTTTNSNTNNINNNNQNPNIIVGFLP